MDTTNPLLSSIPSARRMPRHVTPSASLTEAIQIMSNNGFSQLPVVGGISTLKGYINWKSICINTQYSYKEPQTVNECMEVDFPAFLENKPLLEVMDKISGYDFVFVLGMDNKLQGIVTSSDILTCYCDLAEPYFLIGQIELGSKQRINSVFRPEVIRESRDPSDKTLEIQSSSDLSLGGIKRLLENPSNWDSFSQGKFDRKDLICNLERLIRIRNDFMHYKNMQDRPSSIDFLRHLAFFINMVCDKQKLAPGK